MNSVVATSMILDRMNKMENGPEGKATRKEDQAALELLASRGITAELRAKLAEAVKVATSASRVEEDDQAELAAADEKYVRALGELKAWYEEWSRVARVVVKRRDHLIMLGLAQRKAPGQPGEPQPTDPQDE